MAKHLEDIFNECLERIRQGESIESCLSSYPEYADDLEELLSTVLNVRWRASVAQPRPEFKAHARAQFLGSLRYARQVEKPKHSGIFTLQRAWVPALASVLIFLFGTVGTAAASTTAMPDQPLYHVKLATEQVRLTFTLSDTEKVLYNVKLAENRSQEIVYMAEKGETEQIAEATVRLSKHLEEANVVIARIEEEEMKVEATRTLTATTPSQPEPITRPAFDATKDTESQLASPGGEEQAPVPEDAVPKNSVILKELVKESISRNITSLDSTLQKVSEATRPAVQEAIDASRKLEQEIREMPRTGTITEPVPAQPENIKGVRPENLDTESTTGSKELEIKVRPATNSNKTTTTSDTESEKIENPRTNTENIDTSTSSSTGDSSVSSADNTGTDNRSSLTPLNVTSVVSTASYTDRLIITIKK